MITDKLHTGTAAGGLSIRLHVDDFMKHDKLKHILSGFGSALLVSIPVYVTTKDLFTGLWVCLWVGIIVGLVKEWCDNDYSLKGRFDWRDFVWTVAGAALVALFIIGLHFGKG